MGIKTNQVIAVTFAIGSALGAVAGIMVGLSENITPTMGYYKGLQRLQLPFSAALATSQGQCLVAS